MSNQAEASNALENVDIIDSEEQLQEYLKGSTQEPGAGKGEGKGASKTSPEASEEEDEELTGTTGKTKKKPVTLDPNNPEFRLPTEDEEGEEEEEEDEEFTNVVQYLDSQFDLGLNLKELPPNMTREQEAEAVGELFNRVNQGMQAKLGEYQQIDNLLKDKEVAMFLQAKKEGKTLKDFVAIHARVADGAPDDVIVSRHLKKMLPTLNDAEIAEQVQLYKEKNKLEKMAASAREYFKTEDAAEEVSKQKAKEKADADADQQYRADVQEFGVFLQNTNKVYGVPITPEMKKNAFKFVTARNNEGLTEHDKMLQSSAGSFLSALGILYMKDILRNGTNMKANKAKQDFKQRLFNEPSQLQSGSETEKEADFNPALANQF